MMPNATFCCFNTTTNGEASQRKSPQLCQDNKMTLLPPAPSTPPQSIPLQPNAFVNSAVPPAMNGQQGASGGFDIWGPLQRRKYLIALFAMIGAALGYLYNLNSPKLYQSNVRLMVTTNAPPAIVNGDVRLKTESMDKHASLIASELVLAEASTKGEFGKMPLFHDTSYPVSELSMMIKVIPDTKETMIISCTGTHPEDLPAVLNQIVTTYKSQIKDDSQAVGQNAIDMIQRLAARLNQEKDDAFTERDRLFQQLQIQATDNDGFAINPHNRPLAVLQEQVERQQIQLSDVQDRARLLLKNLEIDEETGEIDRMKIAIEAIAARDYLKLTQQLFKEDAAAGDRVVRNLSPEIQRRQAVQNKVWNLDTKLEDLKFSRAELSTKYGSGHGRIAAIDKQIKYYATQRAALENELAELAKFIDGNLAKDTDAGGGGGQIDLATFRANEERDWVRKYQLRLQQEQEQLTGKIERLNARMVVTSNKARGAASDIVRLNRYQQDIKQKAEAVTAITDKLSEMNILNDSYSMTNVRVLDKPARGRLVAPSLPKSLALGTVLALLVGFGLAILVDQSELAYRSPSEIFEKLQVPVVGKIPRINVRDIDAKKGHASLVAAHKPSATASESFRDVRTALFFRANMDDIKTILFTSPSPGDGKSTTIANMAISIAQAGKKVVLVDADFRRPRVHKYFGEELNPGLMDVLKGDLSLKEAIQKAELQEGLFLLPAGGRPNNPGELVTSEAFRELIEALRAKFDYVLIDSPPVLPVSDPATIASMVDGVYMVTRIRKGVKLTSQKAKETLDRVGANWMGIIVNALDENPHYSEYGYQYGSYSYYGGMYGRYYDANNKGYRDKINAS